MTRSAPWRDGWHAHRLDGTNPHHPLTTSQSWSRAEWVAGWTARSNYMLQQIPTPVRLRLNMSVGRYSVMDTTEFQSLDADTGGLS